MTTLIRPEGQTPDDLKLSRRAVGALGGLLFSGYAVAALAKEAQPITTDAAGLETAEVTYPAPDGFQLPAYVARPAGDGPFPVVIVVSEIFGVHAYIKDICRRLAKQGYAAIAPAFFNRVEDPAPLADMGRIIQIVGAANYEQVMGDLSATLEWASQQLWSRDGKVGITGFCWGGKVVWQAAARFAVIGAGVAWYGRLAPAPDATPVQVSSGQPWPVDLAADLKAPVLGLYGGKDQGIPLASVERMREALARAGQTGSRIVVYPDAPHGFHADYRASYAEADAKDGWSKLLETFDKSLRG
ncbi:dienelactone hydrolase family protein [Brevundimonas sp. SL130]|uniref:dienelactone hydrolase family protein n=1 Tax=Brevundimonas sp. SL130 TaxID=2995143 RepID=UPI00226C9D22|nr:dienelactone hydrolase family protein [Brevundimonas sp. SL130]WAC60013.1 dienelactone hydrolase family protein [Brevundimonas sp. SL130]